MYMNIRTAILLILLSALYSCGNNNSTPDPEITEIQPESGPPGTMVTIMGSGFTNDKSALTITFNEMSADISSASENEIQATVPEGAVSGPISVTVGEVTANGPHFTVEPKAPVINSIDPDSGSVGTEVLIRGMNFSTTKSENTITFNGVLAPVLGYSETELLTEVPEGASDGPVEVTVDGKTAIGPKFHYTIPLVEKVIFATNPDGDYDIYTINPNGSGQKKIFDTTADERFPVVSNSGTKLIFRQKEAGDNELYIANADGTSLQKLTDLPDFIFTASFSPDDSQILFSNGTEDGAEIYLINVDGTGLEQLIDNDAWNKSPQLSPNGSKILFSSNLDGDFEIYTMDPDGSDMKQLTNNNVQDDFAKWMPDGTEIVFHSERKGIYGDIYRMEGDGSNVRRITTKDEGATNPHPSPDGSRIVFMKYRELHIINSDGSGTITQITNNPNRNEFQIGPPDWALIEKH